MGSGVIALCSLGLAVVSVAGAAQIDGTVIIERRLTKRKVTMPVGSYERGVAVPPGSADDSDALAFERAHVVVYIDGGLPAQPSVATMDQKNKQFGPDLLAISAGSTVSFPNLDPIFHNVFSLSKTKEFDLGNYAKDKTRSVTFPKPGIVFVNCRLHPNMTAVIVVCPNGFHVIPDANGRFVLSGMPPGVYKIVAWHKTAGFFRQTITVSEREPAFVQFMIPLLADRLSDQ
jgi:plastocyanin